MAGSEVGELEPHDGGADSILVMPWNEPMNERMSANRRPQWIRTGGVCLLIIFLLWLTVGAPRRFLNSTGYLLLTGGVGTLSWYCWRAVRDRSITVPSSTEAL